MFALQNIADSIKSNSDNEMDAKMTEAFEFGGINGLMRALIKKIETVAHRKWAPS